MLFGLCGRAANRRPDKDADADSHARSASDIDAITRRAHSFADANPDIYAFLHAHSNTNAYGPHVRHAVAVAGCPLCYANADRRTHSRDTLTAIADALTDTPPWGDVPFPRDAFGVGGVVDQLHLHPKLPGGLHGSEVSGDGDAGSERDRDEGTVKESK
jgi:hypothetical protein